MASKLTLKVNSEPTIFNKEMAIGTLLFPIVGTIIGGYMGKSRMEDEAQRGRITTDEPSFWNKDTFLGGLLGSIVGHIAGLALAAVGFMAAGPAGALAGHAIGQIAGIAGGIYVGGKMGQNRLKHDHEEAKHQAIVGHISQTVSPEAAKGMEYALAHGKEWQQGLTEDKLLADARQPSR